MTCQGCQELFAIDKSNETAYTHRVSSFFERNKEKSALAALLLLFRRGKAGLLLLLIILALSGVVVVPGNWRLGGSMRSASGISGLFGGSLGRESSENFSWNALFTRSARMDPSRSGVDYVDGKLPDRARYRVADARSIAGVFTPEDAAKKPDGLALTKEELVAGLVRSAEAGMIAGGAPARTGGPIGVGALDGRRALGDVSTPLPGDTNVSATLRTVSVPSMTRSLQVGGPGRPGRMQAFGRNQAKYKLLANSGRGQKCMTKDGGYIKSEECNALEQLAQAYGYSDAAKPASNKEFGAKAAGAVFDGGMPSGSLIGAPGDDGASVADEGQINTSLNKAREYKDKLDECQAVMQRVSQKKSAAFKELEKLSCELGRRGMDNDGRRGGKGCEGIPYSGCGEEEISDMYLAGGCMAKRDICRDLHRRMREQCRTIQDAEEEILTQCKLGEKRYVKGSSEFYGEINAFTGDKQPFDPCTKPGLDKNN